MNDERKIPAKIEDVLGRVEAYYGGVMDWLVRLYDPKTGGFYMALSGAEDPSIEPAIEMTAWAIYYLYDYTEAPLTMPKEFKDGIIKFINDRQDPKTGIFIDRQGPANPRETARNQDAALNALAYLGADTRYPHPRNTSSSAADIPIMPAYMSSTESYIKWIESMDWEHGSWTAGDQTQSSLQYVNMLGPSAREKYKAALFSWLEDRQQSNGFFSPDFDFNAVSGAFKVGLVYATYEKKLPNYDKIIDSIFECYKVAKTKNPFYVRNPISVLNQMAAYSPDAKAKIQSGIIENIDAVLASFSEFLCPDGAFSASKGASMVSFGGVVGSHGLFEGDIDATLMMLIARKTLYAIFDMAAPPLDTTHFWDKIISK